MRCQIIFLLLLVLLSWSCGPEEKIKSRKYTGNAFEISLYANDKVVHGQWVKIDTILFVHDQYSKTQFIDGALPKDDNYPTLSNYIELNTSSYLAYKSPERDWEENASNNELILELALKTAALKNKNKFIYKIHGGSKLLYEGKLVLSRQDRANFNITLSKEHPFNIKILE